MFHKICKRNLGPLRNFTAYFTGSKEEVEHGANALMHKPEAKKFTENYLGKSTYKPLLFLGYTQSALSSTFLNPYGHPQAKVLLWNSMKRQYNTQCSDYNLAMGEIVPKPIKKMQKSIKRMEYATAWDPPNKTEDYMPRYDDVYKNLLKNVPSKTAISRLLSTKETLTTAELKPAVIKDLPVSRPRPTVLKDDVKLNAPRPSFSESQSQIFKENATGERYGKNYDKNKMLNTPLMRLRSRSRLF